MASNVTFIPPKAIQPDILRVAAYCRVSSDSDDQLHSYLAMQEYEERHPYAWEEERLQPDRQEPVNAPTVSVPAWSVGAAEEWNGMEAMGTMSSPSDRRCAWCEKPPLWLLTKAAAFFIFVGCSAI